MKIRRAKLEDLKEITNLRRKTIIKVNGKVLTKKHVNLLLKMNSKKNISKKIKNKAVVIAIENNKIVGTIELFNKEISGLYVKNNLINKGIGTKLIGYIEKLAKNRKNKKVKIICNYSSKEFYNKKGYKVIKEKILNKCEPQEKIFIMEKKL